MPAASRTRILAFSNGLNRECDDVKLDRKWALVIVSLGIVAGFFVLREHWAHALGLAPYALLLACPLLHLFHGHGGHKKHEDHHTGSDKTA